jgi:hypothetical protein
VVLVTVLIYIQLVVAAVLQLQAGEVPRPLRAAVGMAIYLK